MAPVRVMLVDDSPLFIGAMKAAIEKDPALTVVATAANGADALALVPTIRPSVIVCDVQMPRMSGIEFLKALLPKYPIPVLVISGTPGATLAALANGAVEFIKKPGADGGTSPMFFSRLITSIKVAAMANMSANAATHKPVPPHANLVLNRTAPDLVVAIGASTGGTEAIAELVRDLPANFPATSITQHMPAGFTAMYAARLAKECKMRVREVKDGDRVEQGLILLAAGDYHMRLCKDARGYYASSKHSMRVNGHMPSVEVLFESVAELAGARAVGIILTGMGGDGAEGLLKMRQAGAYTFGQDKETSVVYGMPAMAFNKGAVIRQLPLPDIAPNLVAQVNRM